MCGVGWGGREREGERNKDSTADIDLSPAVNCCSRDNIVLLRDTVTPVKPLRGKYQ